MVVWGIVVWFSGNISAYGSTLDPPSDGPNIENYHFVPDIHGDEGLLSILELDGPEDPDFFKFDEVTGTQKTYRILATARCISSR